VDITEGIPDPIADPLPDSVVNHVGTVPAEDFQPKPLLGNDPMPPDIATPEDSPLDVVPYSALHVSHLTNMRSKKAAEAVPNGYSDGQLDGDSSAKVTICAERPVTSSQ